VTDVGVEEAAAHPQGEDPGAHAVATAQAPNVGTAADPKAVRLVVEAVTAPAARHAAVAVAEAIPAAGAVAAAPTPEMTAEEAADVLDARREAPETVARARLVTAVLLAVRVGTATATAVTTVIRRIIVTTATEAAETATAADVMTAVTVTDVKVVSGLETRWNCVSATSIDGPLGKKGRLTTSTRMACTERLPTRCIWATFAATLASSTGCRAPSFDTSAT